MSGRGEKIVSNADVVFADDGGDGTAIPISGYALAHPSWDLCILNLNAPGDAVLPAPLTLAPVQQPGEEPALRTHRDIAIIGYPADVDNTGRIFRAPGLLHISAGVVLAPSALGTALQDNQDAAFLAGLQDDWETAIAAHDASTCPGFSGAPVLDLEKGEVVGIHVWGSALDPEVVRHSDWNDMVDLSAARRDPWLDDHLQGRDQQAPPPGGRPKWVGSGHSSVNSPEFMRGIGQRLRRLRPNYLMSGVTADRPDFRDLPFIPSLSKPLAQVRPPKHVKIGDQKGEPTCAAFAVAAAIEPQLAKGAKASTGMTVSVRMLDALGKDQDEFMDDEVAGTTLRGVLKGFFHNGVCCHGTGTAQDGQPFLLTRRMAKEARGITLGTYFRVAPVLTDMQMAVQQARAVVVSAHIHKGWQPPSLCGGKRKPVETIPFDGLDEHPREGAHAFLVTGYTKEGFVVQNSWGRHWGAWQDRPGHALWSYADWAANVIDAWVIRISASTPAGFGLIAGQADHGELPVPRRAQLLGHMIQTEADRIVERGTLGLGLQAIRETARFLSGSDPDDHDSARSYTHLLFIFHDPMLGADLISRIAARMTPQLKARHIYPFHLCHGLDELRTLSLRLAADAELVKAGFAGSLLPWDHYLERHVALTSQRLIEQYRRGARRSSSLRQAIGELLAPGVRHPDWLPTARKTAVLAVATGAIPAMACASSFGPKVPRVFLAPPVTVPRGSTLWRLGPERKEGPVPGYPGEWVDLLSRSLGQAADPRGTDPKDPGFGWDSLSAALIDPALPARLRDLS